MKRCLDATYHSRRLPYFCSIVVEILRDYGYVDARGVGIRTKVVPSLKAQGMAPQFQATEDDLRSILPNIWK